MTRPLLVGVSHGLDLLTLMLVLTVYSIEGEWNPLARATVVAGGTGLLILLKALGALALALMVHRPVWPLTAIHRWGLVPAVGMGILGAEVNLLAYAVR